MTKTELKQIAEDSRGFPTEFIKAVKKDAMIFVHSHGDLDACILGMSVQDRPTVVRWIGTDLLIVKGIWKSIVGHIFLGRVRSREFVNAYIEKIEGDTAYITSMSIHIENKGG